MPDFEIHFLSVKQTTFTSPTCKVLINFQVLGPKSQIDFVQVHRAMRGEVCLGTSKAARFSVGPPSTTSFDGPLLAVTANCRCSRQTKARSSARKRRNLANVGSLIS
jgi:hypothetical protein